MFVVQFCLQLLLLRLKTATFARKIHNNLTSITIYHKQLEDTSQETILMYILDRILNINHLKFYLTNNYVEDFEKNFFLQADLMINLAR